MRCFMTPRLRAQTGLKIPDALHAATALRASCALFITNDTDFRRIQGLPAVILDDLLAEESKVMNLGFDFQQPRG